MHKAEERSGPVAEIRLERPMRLADALQAVREIRTWRFNEPIPPPTDRTTARMLQLVLAVAPLTMTGPAAIILGPSVYGGLYARFFDENCREIAVILRNDGLVRCLYSLGWGPFEGAETTALDDAIAAIKERFEDAASLRRASRSS